VNTPELTVSGVCIERGEDTMGHYQVALSCLKAMWQVFTQLLGVTARFDPFYPDQTILISLGDGRWQSSGTSVGAPMQEVFDHKERCKSIRKRGELDHLW
jgi:hypothetical protein